MDNNISVRIYIQDGTLKHIVPEFPWEGQISAQVVYHDIEFDKLDGSFCREFACPEGPELHKHDWFTTAVIRAESMQSEEYDPDNGPCHDCGTERPDWGSRTNCSRCGAGLDWNCVAEHQCNTPQAKRKPHVHTYEQKPGGERRMDANCGAYVCLDCNDHDGLARCYCGWARDGGDGVAQLRAEGENVEDDY